MPWISRHSHEGYELISAVYYGIGDPAVDFQLHHLIADAVCGHAVGRVGAGFIDQIHMMLQGADDSVHTVTADPRRSHPTDIPAERQFLCPFEGEALGGIAFRIGFYLGHDACMVGFGEALRLLRCRRLGGLRFCCFRGRLCDLRRLSLFGRFCYLWGFGLLWRCSRRFGIRSLFFFCRRFVCLFSLSAGRLLSAVGSEVLSVTVILLSVLTAPLSVWSFALSAAHPARLSVISPARRTASIFSVIIDITSIYRIPIIREKSSIFYKLRKQVTLTAQKQVLHLRQVLRIQSAVQPALVPFSAHRHQEHIR